MYERSYGYRYAELGDHPSAAEIAKAVRGDIKQAQAEGFLPARWSYSVRSDSFSGGQSVDIDVRDCADARQACDGGAKCHDVWCDARNDPTYAHAAQPHRVLTAEAEAAKMTLERIHNAYNHDGSEIMVDYFDVRYYGGVTFETDDGADFRKREAERLAAKRAARESGEVVGKVANFSRDRGMVVHVLKRTAEGKTVLACGARMQQRGIHGRAADDAVVTCSRCAKHER